MDINEQTLARIAHLARLELKEAHKEQMLKELNDMIHWVEKLQEVDTEGVEPLTNMSNEINAWREDQVQAQITREQALAQAPNKDQQFFKVPKFLK